MTMGCGSPNLAARPVDGGITESPEAAVGVADAGGAPGGPHCGALPRPLVRARDLFAPDAGLAGKANADMSLAVDANYLYYAIGYNGHVMRVPLTGGEPVVVSAIEGWALRVFPTSTDVVFAESFPAADGGQLARIRRVRSAGGAPTTIAQVAGSLSGDMFDSDGIFVYFADPSGMKRVPIAGGAVETLTTHTGSISIVGSDLVVTDRSGGNVYAVPLAGGAERMLVSQQSNPSFPVSCGADLCWTTNVPGNVAWQGTGTVVQMSPGAAPSTVASDSSLYLPIGLIFDGTDFIVLANHVGHLDGYIARVPGSGGSPVAVASGSSATMDRNCLYYSSIVNGIFTVNRSYAGPPNP